MSKSKTRWVRDAASPHVSLGGTFYDPKAVFHFFSVNDNKPAFKVEMEWWQFRNMCRDARAVARTAAQRHRSIADTTEDFSGVKQYPNE